MAARLLSDVGRGPGALGWTYALTLGFGLVYLGEHYVIDLMAGWRSPRARAARPHAGPLLAAGRRVQRLEPGAADDGRPSAAGSDPTTSPRARSHRGGRGGGPAGLAAC